MAVEAKKVDLHHDWSANQWDWPEQAHDGIVKVINTPERFEVGLEIHHFLPNEVDVKVINHELVIYCRHETRSDRHGTIARELNRTYKLPADVDITTLKSVLSKTGVLLITAQKKK